MVILHPDKCARVVPLHQEICVCEAHPLLNVCECEARPLPVRLALMVIKPRITIIVKVHRLPNVVTIHLCNPLHNLGVTIHRCNPPQIQGMIILPLILYLAVGRALTQITGKKNIYRYKIHF